MDACSPVQGCTVTNAAAGAACGQSGTCDGGGQCLLNCIRVVTSSLVLQAAQVSDIALLEISYAMVGAGGAGGGAVTPAENGAFKQGKFVIGNANGLAVYVGGGGGGGSNCSGSGGGGSGYFGGGGGGGVCTGGGGGSSAIVGPTAGPIVANGGAAPVDSFAQP